MLVTLEFSNRSSISDLNVTSSTGTLHMVDLWKLSQNHISRSKFIGHSLFESPLRSSSLSLHSIAGRSDFVPTTRFFTRPDNCSFSFPVKSRLCYHGSQQFPFYLENDVDVHRSNARQWSRAPIAKWLASEINRARSLFGEGSWLWISEWCGSSSEIYSFINRFARLFIIFRW